MEETDNASAMEMNDATFLPLILDDDDDPMLMVMQ